MASDQPTAAGSISPRLRRKSASRAACPPRAVLDRADTGQRVTSEATRSGRRAGSTAPVPSACSPSTVAASATRGRYSSRMTWALVPLTPKEETPPRRGRSSSGHGLDSVSRETAPDVQSTCGDGSSMCRVSGMTPLRSAITILTRPATPAALWVWPMFDFTEPSHSGRSAGRSCPYVAMSACASIGSPRVVPVPCASTMSTSAVESRALARAWRMTRCWEGPLGAVSPLEAPSWLRALPRITARTGWPLRSASASRSTTSTPPPSPQPVPSAPAAKALHRPSTDMPRCREKTTNTPGVTMTVTPPAMARSHSPRRSAFTARCRATSEEEQAVSTVTAGPLRPRVNEIRPDATLVVLPVPMYMSTPSGTCGRPMP